MFEKIREELKQQEAPINLKKWNTMIQKNTEYIKNNAKNHGIRLTYGRAKLITEGILSRFEDAELK